MERTKEMTKNLSMQPPQKPFHQIYHHVIQSPKIQINTNVNTNKIKPLQIHLFGSDFQHSSLAKLIAACVNVHKPI